MFTPYTGNGAYCFTNGLHMCLSQAGMAMVPDVGLLECMTGMPFGATFLKLQTPLFFPSPSGTDPDRGLTRALETVGWTCEVLRFEEADKAQRALYEALQGGTPVLIGPLDMGYLPYDPTHAFKRGGDHFVVALKLADDLVQVHDPQLYPFAVLPITDLMRAWSSKHLGYSLAEYTFRCNFRAERSVSEEQMLAETLKTVSEMTGSAPTGPVAYGGAQAFSQAAEVLRTGPPDGFTGLLTHFALPLGARRSLDAARFLNRVGKFEAARLLVSKGEVFGQAQYYAARSDWTRTAELFDYLSSIETKIASAR